MHDCAGGFIQQAARPQAGKIMWLKRWIPNESEATVRMQLTRFMYLYWVSDHPFVKVWLVANDHCLHWRTNCRPAMIQCRRYVVAHASVIWVEHMFNLGPCYITVGVFKNMSVLQKDTVFPRLTMFHVDGDEDMYGKLFTSLRDTFASEVAFAESAGAWRGHWTSCLVQTRNELRWTLQAVASACDANNDWDFFLFMCTLSRKYQIDAVIWCLYLE